MNFLLELKNYVCSKPIFLQIHMEELTRYACCHKCYIESCLDTKQLFNITLNQRHTLRRKNMVENKICIFCSRDLYILRDFNHCRECTIVSEFYKLTEDLIPKTDD